MYINILRATGYVMFYADNGAPPPPRGSVEWFVCGSLCICIELSVDMRVCIHFDHFTANMFKVNRKNN